MKKVYPSGGRQLFDGGLNNKYAVSIIEPNESPDCLNVIFDAGAAESRRGSTTLNTTSVGSFPIDGLYTYRNNAAAESMVIFCGDLMYTLSGTTFYTTPSAQSVFVNGNRVCAAQQENYMFLGNGQTLPYKYNGAFTRHGVYPPTQTAAVVSNGVGNLTASGQYLYGYTSVNSNLVESNLSPISTTFTISSTSGQNTVSNLQTLPVSYGVNNIYLYRVKANTTTPYFRVTTLANGTTSFNDNVADSALSIQAPTDNGVPPNYSVITYAVGRLFCNDNNNPNLVWYSEANTPYTFKSSNFFKVGDNSSDLVKGLAYYNQSLLVFCENSIYIIYLTDPSIPSTWVQNRLDTAMGSKSPYSVFQYNNKLGFAAFQNKKFVGFAALKGNVVDTNKTFLTVSATGSDLISDRIEPDMYLIQESYLQNITSFVYKKKAWIAVTYGTGAIQNNRVYQLDFSMSNIKKDMELSWCPFDGIHASQFTVYNGNLYYGSADRNGFVYQTDVANNYNDSGVAINSYYWTKEYVGEEDDPEGSDTNLVKDFRYCNILVDNSGVYYMNFTYKNDSDKGNGTVQTVSLDPGGTKWGTMVWGVDAWGVGFAQAENRLFLSNSRGRRIQFRFDNQNTVNQKFKVHGLNFLYNIKGLR